MTKNEKFLNAINDVSKEKDTIGKLKEKTVHKVIKNYYASKENQEIKIGTYYADAVLDDVIIEVQTKQFHKLKDKIDYFFEKGYKVRVVYPLVNNKTIYYIDALTNEVESKKASPKKGNIFEIFFELYTLKEYIENEKLYVTIISFDCDEYKYLDGYGEKRKIKATKIDKIPKTLISEINLEKRNDFCVFKLDIASPFSSKEFSRKAKISLSTSQRALIVLTMLGLVKRIGKQGNSYLYEYKD